MHSLFVSIRRLKKNSLAILPSGLLLWAVAAQSALASVYNGGGLNQGVDEAGQIVDGRNANVREIIVRVLATVLDFVILAVVIAIVVAGIFLIVSGGSDTSKDKAKKIILYAIVGLIIILLAKLVVGFVLETFATR